MALKTIQSGLREQMVYIEAIVGKAELDTSNHIDRGQVFHRLSQIAGQANSKSLMVLMVELSLLFLLLCWHISMWKLHFFVLVPLRREFECMTLSVNSH